MYPQQGFLTISRVLHNNLSFMSLLIIWKYQNILATLVIFINKLTCFKKRHPCQGSIRCYQSVTERFCFVKCNVTTPPPPPPPTKGQGHKFWKINCFSTFLESCWPNEDSNPPYMAHEITKISVVHLIFVFFCLCNGRYPLWGKQSLAIFVLMLCYGFDVCYPLIV